MAIATQQPAEGRAARIPVSVIAEYLQDVLGQRLTAVIAEVSDARAVGRWARGEQTPAPKTEQRLRHTFRVAELLMQVEAADTSMTRDVSLGCSTAGQSSRAPRSNPSAIRTPSHAGTRT